MALIQLDFFEETEISVLKARIEAVEKSKEKVRKGLYAENGALKKRVTELEEEVTFIKRMICHGKN